MRRPSLVGSTVGEGSDERPMAFSSLPYSMRFSFSILSAMLGCQGGLGFEALKKGKRKGQPSACWDKCIWRWSGDIKGPLSTDPSHAAGHGHGNVESEEPGSHLVDLGSCQASKLVAA